MKKRIVNLALALVVALGITSCAKKEENKLSETSNSTKVTESSLKEDNKIKIGVSPVPHEEIIEALKDQFKEKGLDVEIVAFDDYVQPNLALAQGDLDCNYFQHQPYLDSFSKEHDLKLKSVGAVHIEPMGFYSDKIKSLDELQEGDEVIIPNDPSNGARALLLLEKNGLIKLKDSTNLNSTEKDIAENKKNLKFTAVDAATIPNVYKDAKGAVINSNFALGAGLTPGVDSIVIEDKDSPYANIVVVKEGDENKEKFKVLMEVLQSDDCKKFIEEKYKGSIHPSF